MGGGAADRRPSRRLLDPTIVATDEAAEVEARFLRRVRIGDEQPRAADEVRLEAVHSDLGVELRAVSVYFGDVRDLVVELDEAAGVEENFLYRVQTITAPS